MAYHDALLITSFELVFLNSELLVKISLLSRDTKFLNKCVTTQKSQLGSRKENLYDLL